METMVGTGAALDERSVEDDRMWARIGRSAAYAAAIGFFAVTVLFLLDEFDVLGPSPEYVSTSAGQLQDEARFWAQVFEHEHAILWDIVARDIVGPAAFLALIVVGVAMRRRTHGNGPARELMVPMLAAGGVISAIASLLYLGNAEFWRLPWGAVPEGGETSLVAVGRATTAIDNLTVWPEAFGYVVVALGILCLGAVVRRANDMPDRLGALANVTAVVLFCLAIVTTMDADTARSIVTLVVGAILAPVLCTWIGHELGRASVARDAASLDDDPRRG
jgi:hypothetical protein